MYLNNITRDKLVELFADINALCLFMKEMKLGIILNLYGHFIQFSYEVISLMLDIIEDKRNEFKVKLTDDLEKVELCL